MDNNKAYKALKANAKSLGIFANLETLGCYDDFSQIVMIDYLDRDSLLQLQQSFKSHFTKDLEAQKLSFLENYKSISKFYSTCVHELTHWLDHTSTLWGQKQLILIYNAIHAWTNQQEKDFYRIAIANSERYRARLGEYYTEKYEPSKVNSNAEKWSYTYSSGIEFGFDGKPREDRPFICTIFLNSDKQRIIRVPISMFALTEANATYAELKVKSQFLISLGDDGIVERKIFEREVYQNLYNSELAIYSSATHCLANSIGITDILVAYKYTSALATFCLNLPTFLYSNLTVPPRCSHIEGRVQALKDLADPGFAFFAIAQQAPKYQDNISIDHWLQAAIKNSGLPSLEIINDLILEQMEALKNEIIYGSYVDELINLLIVGKVNFTKRGIWGQNVLSLENLENNSILLPPIVLGDEFIVPVFPNTTIHTRQNNIKQWMDDMIEIELRMDKFVRACRL